MINKDLGKRIELFRTLKGRTQVSVATKLEISERTLQRYEKGEEIPSLEMLEKIATELGVRMVDMFEEDPDVLLKVKKEQILDEVWKILEKYFKAE